MPSPQTELATRAMLEGALQKANYAVQAEKTEDFEYAVESYNASCDLVLQVMKRTEQGSEDWSRVDGIVCENRRVLRDLTANVDPNSGRPICYESKS